jgi:hypothetical protein
VAILDYESKTQSIKRRYDAIIAAMGLNESEKRTLEANLRIIEMRKAFRHGAETPLGEKLEAKFDGKLYQMEDDPGHTMVSVKLINPHTVEQTNVRDGKIVFIVMLEVTSDGKTIHATSKSKEGGSVKTRTLRKQSK